MRYVDLSICCLYIVDPPDNEQQACSKHVEVYYLNKLIKKWCILLVHIIRIYHDAGQQNFKETLLWVS